MPAFRYQLKQRKTRSTKTHRTRVCGRAASAAIAAATAREKTLIYNQWQLKPMKFLKECDCCQKELGTTMLRSALVPLKAVAEGLWESCWKAGGHRPARKWILHTVRIIAQFRAVILNLWSTNCASWNRQPSFMSSCFLLSCCKQALLWAVSLPLSAYEDHTDRPHQQP